MASWPYSTATWARLRRLKLSESPLCERCKPRIVPAEHVDHRIPISAGGDPFPSLSGLAALCASCHSRKTREDEGRCRPPIDPDTGRRVGDTGWWGQTTDSEEKISQD